MPFFLRLTGTPANSTVSGETEAALKDGELRIATGTVPIDPKLTVLEVLPGLMSICTSNNSRTKQSLLNAMFGSDGLLGEELLFK